jgi:hypothetical protein
MNDSRKKLYDQLSQDNNIGTWDEFNTKMDNPDSRQRLYSILSKDYDLGDFKTFESKIGVDIPPKQPLKYSNGIGLLGFGSMLDAVQSVGQSFNRAVNQIQQSGTKVPGFIGQFTPMPTGTEMSVKDPNKLVAGSMGLVNTGIEASGLPLAPLNGTPVGAGLRAMMLPGQGVSNLIKSVVPQMSPEIGAEYDRLMPLIATAGLTKAIGSPAVNRVAQTGVRGLSKGMELFDEALPTQAKEFTRHEDIRNIIPYIKEEWKKNPTTMGNRENSVVRQTDERVFKNIENKIYGDRTNLIIAHKDTPIPDFGDNVGNAVGELQNILTENVDLLKGDKIRQEVATWKNKGSATLGEAYKFQRALNDATREVWKKTPAERMAMEGAAKPIEFLDKAAEAVRDIIASKLDEVNGSGNYYKKLSDDYGSASKLRFAAERNKSIAERPTPPFIERIGERVGTSGNMYATAKVPVLFPKIFGVNRKLQSAFKKFTLYGGDLIDPQIPRGMLPEFSQGGLELSRQNMNTNPTFEQGLAGLLPPHREMPPNPSSVQGTPFVPSPTVSGMPQPFTMPDNLRMMPRSPVDIQNIYLPFLMQMLSGQR